MEGGRAVPSCGGLYLSFNWSENMGAPYSMTFAQGMVSDDDDEKHPKDAAAGHEKHPKDAAAGHEKHHTMADVTLLSSMQRRTVHLHTLTLLLSSVVRDATAVRYCRLAYWFYWPAPHFASIHCGIGRNQTMNNNARPTAITAD